MGAYIADDIRRLLKLFDFQWFVHHLYCWGAASGGIHLSSALVAVVVHCSRPPLLSNDGGGVAIEIETVDYLIFIFRCTIRCKCILHLGYS